MEDYPSGYPRYSAILAADNSFQICRRFSVLRTRLLLLKQDKLSLLEQRLEAIDTNERRRLFLGSSREDKNEERVAVLAEIDKALADYGMQTGSRASFYTITKYYGFYGLHRLDEFTERNRRILNARTANPHDIRSLQHWVNGNGCLSWQESEYLKYCHDLCSITPVEDDATTRFKIWIEKALGRLFQSFQDVSNFVIEFVRYDLI